MPETYPFKRISYRRCKYTHSFLNSKKISVKKTKAHITWRKQKGGTLTDSAHIIGID